MLTLSLRQSTSGAVRRGTMIIVAVVTFAGAAWLARPQYRHWKLQRSLSQAQHFLATRNLNAAWLSAQQAFILNSTNLESLRLLAEIAEAAHQPQAVAFRRKVMELDPASLTNRLLWAQTALQFEQPPFSESKKALESVPGPARSTAEFHTLAAALELRRGNVAGAEDHFQSIVSAAPTNRQARINLAVLGLRSADAAKRSDSQQTLEQLRTDPEARVSILRSLVDYCRQSQQLEKALGYSRELLDLKESNLDDQVTHLDILHATAGGDTAFSTCLAAVQGQNASKPDAIATLAAWMRSTDLSAPALTWIQSLPKEIQDQLPVQMSVADLYAAQKKWREMDAYLRDQSWGAQEYARHALVALALRHGGDLEASRLRWNRAFRAASEEPRLLAPLARMVTSWDWREEAEQVLWQIAERNPGEAWAWQNLASQYMNAGDTPHLKKVFELVTANDPKDFTARNNLAVATFLVSTNADELSRAHQLARACYDHESSNPSFIATYAYSLHLQGKSREALDLLEGLKEPQRLEPGTAVYYGVILAATGNRAGAQSPLELAAKTSLLPEERALATKVLSQN